LNARRCDFDHAYAVKVRALTARLARAFGVRTRIYDLLDETLPCLRANLEGRYSAQTCRPPRLKMMGWITSASALNASNSAHYDFCHIGWSIILPVGLRKSGSLSRRRRAGELSAPPQCAAKRGPQFVTRTNFSGDRSGSGQTGPCCGGSPGSHESADRGTAYLPLC
jgi:hypothetical protein